MINKLERVYFAITEPVIFFEGWGKEKLIKWFHSDEFGNSDESKLEQNLLATLSVVEDYAELEWIEIEIFKQLKTLKK